VILQEAPPEEGPKPFLCSRDFELAQANCPWVSALLSFVKSGGREIPADREHARWAQANQGNLLTQRGLLFRCTHCATGKGKLTRQINALLVPAGLRSRVLELAHSHPIYGHKGGLATYQLLRSSYFWPTMKADTAEFVRKCSFCQGKHRHLNPVPPRVRPLPEAPFSVISVDYAGPFGNPGQALKVSHSQEGERREGYSRSRRLRYCLVVVDVLTRYPIFIPVTDVTAQTTVRALQEQVYPRFGYPDVIISDEGSAFKSGTMEAHCAQHGIYQDIVSPGNHKAWLGRTLCWYPARRHDPLI